MSKLSVICHLVVVLATFFSLRSEAHGPVCSYLFTPVSPRILETKSNFNKDNFIKAEMAMPILVNEGIVNQLRTSNPSKDHIEYFANQLPVIAQKLTVKFAETVPVFRKEAELVGSKKRKETIKKTKDHLEQGLLDSYNMLLEEASQRIESKTVTYEWYMSFFLRAMIFTDVSIRIIESPTRYDFELSKRKIDTVLGKSKIFVSEDVNELRLYGTLGKEFSTLTKDSYFTRHMLESTLVPVLFVPRDVDVIQAERLGFHFVSLVNSRKETVDGLKYPLQFAARQVEQNAREIDGFKDLINNNKAKWIKYHDKIAAQVKGDAQLEALYAFILRDVGLQSELTKRFDTSYKWIISFDVHRTSQYLAEYFKANESTVSKVANNETLESFLKIIHQIEKEALDSKSHK